MSSIEDALDVAPREPRPPTTALSSKGERSQKKTGARSPERLSFIGGPCRIRTYDQLIKSQLLYQLS